jgi:hypothetical protein
MNYNQKTDKKFYRDLLYLEQIYKLDVLDCVVMDDKDIGDDTLCIYIKNLGKTTKIRLIGIKECNIEKFSQLRLKYYINPNTNRWNKRLVFEQFMENSS